MAYGNNRASKQGRAHFQLAGGAVIKFRHPYLAGQLDTDGLIDEVDVSACCKLEGEFFSATPNQDSAKQTVLIDGSTVTICNRLLNGTIDMPLVHTSWSVAEGDFINILQLIKSVGDSVGGILIKTDFANGEAITRVYYGVTVQNIPDDKSQGNDVAEYPARLLYAGWIEARDSSSERAKKAIWAVGNQKGISAYFKPYKIQEASTSDDAINTANNGVPVSGATDDLSADHNTNTDAEIAKAKSNDYSSVVQSATEVS